MSFKPNLSRLARLQAGSRMSLPGQDPVREEELRIELTQELQPQDRFEQMWIEDIAYRTAMIEVIRAQIAGHRMRLVEVVLIDLDKRLRERERAVGELDGIECFYGRELDPNERDALERWKGHGTVPVELSNWLGDPQFAWLLGNLEPVQMQVLRQFQLLEHEELRERDRIIRQFERRRRQAVMDAVKLAEVRGQGSLPEETEVRALGAPTQCPAEVEHCVLEDADADERQ